MTTTDVVAVRLPEVPVIVTGYCPGANEALEVKTIKLLEVVGLVVNVAVRPDGRPEADKVTLPE